MRAFSFWNWKIIFLPFITSSYRKRKYKIYSPKRFYKRWFFFIPTVLETCECWRNGSRSHDSGWRYSTNSSGSDRVDAIDFQTNGDVILSGYRLWGVNSGSTSFQVTIRLYRGSSLIAEKTGSYATSSSVKTFGVHFSQVISIRANAKYTATARIVTSRRSFYLTDGLASTSCSGVTVTFTSSSKDSNGSSQSGGQIPVLIFRSSQC